MSVLVNDPDFTLYVGDVLEQLRELPDESVHCVVTSPPYWGLRDYGTGSWAGGNPDCDHLAPPTGGPNPERYTPGGGEMFRAANDKAFRDVCGKCGATRQDQQLGLEATPDLFVAAMVDVFREVRRVLRADGTCWVNLGDSYAGAPVGSFNGGGFKDKSAETGGRDLSGVETSGRMDKLKASGLKPKDLVGIPWAVAKALQAPYYTGRIPHERDRVWLAATIDAEGSICGFTSERGDGDGIRTGVHITITNTSMPLLAEAQRIWPTSRDDGNGHGVSALGTRECRRWIAHNVDDKAALLAELYPYLIAKKQQALLAWNFLEMSRVSKRIGKKAEGTVAKERRAWIVGALSDLNHGRPVDVPTWIKEPPSLFEEGWYLRSDIVWAKPNPMPESVTDRPTKAHEYVFLLTKSPRYFFDAEAVREPHKDFERGANGRRVGSVDERPEAGVRSGTMNNIDRGGAKREYNPAGRNIRSVWEIATQPYPEAHFATFPEALPERCIRAGTSERGCCPVCGAPWDRETESEIVGTPRNEQGHYAKHDGKDGTNHYLSKTAVHGSRVTTTTGWRPSCDCTGADDVYHPNVKPCTVLDPFMGSGTTALVARRLGRRSIGIELNPDYAALCARRLQQLSLFAGEPA